MNKTKIAIACSLFITIAEARIAPGPEGPPETSRYVPQIVFNVSDAFGGAFSGVQIRMPAPNNPSGIISDVYALGSGTSDAGKFLCNGCTIGPQSADLQELNDLINGSINAFLTTNLAWKLGDTVTICNGSWCLTMMYKYPYSTNHWEPAVPITKPDNGKGYKNPNGFPAPTGSSPNPKVYAGRSPVSGQTLYFVFSSPDYNIGLDRGPLIIEPVGGGGGGSGDTCVHVDSRLANGQRAGDVKVGDRILLGDEQLSSREGVVAYSEKKTAPGWRIVTQSGASLVCSETAPILTPEGYLPVPMLTGKMIAVRIDSDEGQPKTGWERVEVLIPVGLIDIQHISVNGQAFWAGERDGAYILHHNKEIASPQP